MNRCFDYDFYDNREFVSDYKFRGDFKYVDICIIHGVSRKAEYDIECNNSFESNKDTYEA